MRARRLWLVVVPFVLIPGGAGEDSSYERVRALLEQLDRVPAEEARSLKTELQCGSRFRPGLLRACGEPFHPDTAAELLVDQWLDQLAEERPFHTGDRARRRVVRFLDPAGLVLRFMSPRSTSVSLLQLLLVLEEQGCFAGPLVVHPLAHSPLAEPCQRRCREIPAEWWLSRALRDRELRAVRLLRGIWIVPSREVYLDEKQLPVEEWELKMRLRIEEARLLKEGLLALSRLEPVERPWVGSCFLQSAGLMIPTSRAAQATEDRWTIAARWTASLPADETRESLEVTAPTALLEKIFLERARRSAADEPPLLREGAVEERRQLIVGELPLCSLPWPSSESWVVEALGVRSADTLDGGVQRAAVLGIHGASEDPRFSLRERLAYRLGSGRTVDFEEWLRAVSLEPSESLEDVFRVILAPEEVERGLRWCSSRTDESRIERLLDLLLERSVECLKDLPLLRGRVGSVLHELRQALGSPHDETSRRLSGWLDGALEDWARLSERGKAMVDLTESRVLVDES